MVSGCFGAVGWELNLEGGIDTLTNWHPLMIKAEFLFCFWFYSFIRLVVGCCFSVVSVKRTLLGSE